MKRWKAAIALFLTLMYLPATGYCLLETANWVPACGDDCEQSDAGHSPSAPCAYGCCPIEYAVYFKVAKDDVAPLPTEIGEVIIPIPLEVLPEQSLVVLPEIAPPELPRLWQFCFRAALQPRAPSFVS